jgi:hypothetical protein
MGSCPFGLRGVAKKKNPKVFSSPSVRFSLSEFSIYIPDKERREAEEASAA